MRRCRIGQLGATQLRKPGEVRTRLSRANTRRCPRSSIEQIRKKTSVKGPSPPKGMPLLVQPKRQKRLAEDFRHRTPRVQQRHAVFQRGGVHVFAGFHRLGHFLGVPEPAGLRGQLDHRVDHRVAGSGTKRHGDRLRSEAFRRCRLRARPRSATTAARPTRLRATPVRPTPRSAARTSGGCRAWRNATGRSLCGRAASPAPPASPPAGG